MRLKWRAAASTCAGSGAFTRGWGAADVVRLCRCENARLQSARASRVSWVAESGINWGCPSTSMQPRPPSRERRHIADIRRGEYEALIQQIRRPEYLPDFGPARAGPAGAVIVGARPILIAFNVFLRSANVAAAKTIARRIRESNGGLPAVRALGLRVDGQAQVSMNLVDYRTTPPLAVVEAIRQEAARQSAALDRSELIGLIPLDALPGCEGLEWSSLSPQLLAEAADTLLLPALPVERILEYALRRL